MPKQRHGLVVFSNHHQSGINSALRFWISDRLWGRLDKDWSRIVQRDYTQGGHRLLREAKAKFAAPHPVKQPPVLPIADFVGTYKSRICRSIHVCEKNGQLLLKCGTRFNGAMKTWHGNSFRVFFSNPQLHDWLVTFNTRDQQAISLRVREAPWAPDWYDDRDDLGEFVKQ